MRLFAAIVPPLAVLEELDAVVRSVASGTEADRGPRRARGRATSAEGQHAGPRRGVLGRRSSAAGRSVGGDAAGLPNNQLSRLPVVRMHIPVATFGHLTRGDSDLLARALRDATASWSRPTLRLAGGAALEWPGDKSVWASLDGDLDALQVIAQGVPKVVQRLSLFVDRRQFRPLLSVGSITDETTAPYLEALVAALERFEGMTWTQESVSLMSGQPEAGPDEPFEEMEAMRLSDA
jgi:2'-5' RNA ligase